MQTVIKIPGLCCPSEEKLIRGHLSSLSQISELSFDYLQRQVTVMHQLDDPVLLIERIRALGLEADFKEKTVAEIQHHGITLTTKVLLGISALFAVGAELADWFLPHQLSGWIVILAILSIAACAKEIFPPAWRAVRSFSLNTHFLMLLAIIGAFATGHFAEAAMVAFLFSLAEMLEDVSQERAGKAIGDLLSLAPQNAQVEQIDGTWRETEVATIKEGQKVRVRPGESVPLDGEVISGASTVNQAPITGESMPVEKTLGDMLFAGSINGSGVLEFRAQGDAAHSTIARIVQAVQEAQTQRAPVERMVDRFAHYYTPAVVVCAITFAILPPLLFGQSWSLWFYRALVLLVISCPCAFVISTPVTLVSALAAAARRGILIKGSVYLEAGSRLRCLALDKTGTLTQGIPSLTDVVPLTDWTHEKVLLYAASINAASHHPVADAMLAATNGIQLLPAENYQMLIGRGATAHINGKQFFIGNHRLAEENKVCSAHVEKVLSQIEKQGKTSVVLTNGQHSIAVLGVADTIRQTSLGALDQLRKMGVQLVMLSGDNQKTTQALAQQMKISDAYGELLPEDKLHKIASLQEKYGLVGMVGDGINDAPALAKADISFAMGAAGSDTAIETANVALMADDLSALPEFLRLSRRAMSILKVNLGMAIGIKILFFAMALFGYANLWMAVFADTGVSLLVVANGLRLLKSEKVRNSNA
jgi:Cd2+/Zn2+-exporting ATPase